MVENLDGKGMGSGETSMSGKKIDNLMTELIENRKHPLVNLFLGIVNISQDCYERGDMSRKRQAEYITNVARELGERFEPL